MFVLSVLFAQAAVALPPKAVSVAPLPGIWSVEASGCAAGEAWVFTADGYYAEVTLPSSPIHAVGVWEDKGSTIDYTHAHAPFASLATPQPRRSYRVTSRTADRIEALNYKNEKRIFQRCPAGSLRADK